MSFKIPCGGFKLDEKSFSLDENGVLSVSGGGGGGVQPDWNQNDSTAEDYVKNRPFYTGDPVETVLVEESTVSFTNAGGLYIAQIQSNFEATAGETYKVTWDGTVYECTCVDFNGPFMGNLSILGGGSDTGEPFAIFVYNSGNIEIYTKDSSASHTISISGIVEPIVKIPAKFIDKNTSGYIIVHEGKTMTEQEAENYNSAIERTEIVFIKWFDLNISDIGVASGADSTLVLKTINNEQYEIRLNNDGLFNYDDKSFISTHLPDNPDSIPYISIGKSTKRVAIEQNSIISGGEGTTDILFRVKANGTKSKNFDVLGNGEAVTPAIILYSSTADSTKKFRVTVDDSGNLTATEV